MKRPPSLCVPHSKKDGYKWHEAYYLYPIGITDIRTASADLSLENSNLYQNLYWPVSAGGHAEK